MSVVADYFYGSLPREHQPAISLYRPGQRMGYGIASTDDAECALVVEVCHEGMGGEGCLVKLGSIERQVAHEHLG